MLKVCKVCKISKESDKDFLYHSATGYYMNYCKNCFNKRRKLKRLGLPEPEEFKILTEKKPKKEKILREKKVKKVIKLNKPYRKTSYFNRKRLDYKSQDKAKGFENNLTEEFVKKCLTSNCVYCDYPALTLDRVDNSKGHTIENCVPACYECNICRNRIFTFEEMKILGKVIRDIKLGRNGYYSSKNIFPRINFDQVQKALLEESLN